MRVGDDDEIARIVDLLSATSGVDFTAYKPGTLGRRIRTRAALAGAPDLTDYLALLERDAAERCLLLHAALVKTTSMFRDEAVFEALRGEALPALVADRVAAGARTLRAWVPACSTGEEAYSVAMCLREATEAWPIAPSVLASDVDRAALERVARAVYPSEAAAAVPPHLAARWLEPAGDDLVRVREPVRAMVTSSYHDLLDGAYAAPREAVVAAFDLILCRNVLIYLRPAAQERVLLRLLKASTPGALVVLGHVEAPPERLRGEFVELAPRLSIYRVGSGG